MTWRLKLARLFFGSRVDGLDGGEGAANEESGVMAKKMLSRSGQTPSFRTRRTITSAGALSLADPFRSATSCSSSVVGSRRGKRQSHASST